MIMARLEGETIRTEIQLPPHGVSTQFELLRLAEQATCRWLGGCRAGWVQSFELRLGSVTAVLWDDETERGLLIRRDKEIARLQHGDQLCFRWNKPLRQTEHPKPWFVVQDASFPRMRKIEVSVIQKLLVLWNPCCCSARGPNVHLWEPSRLRRAVSGGIRAYEGEEPQALQPMELGPADWYTACFYIHSPQRTDSVCVCEAQALDSLSFGDPAWLEN